MLALLVSIGCGSSASSSEVTDVDAGSDVAVEDTNVADTGSSTDAMDAMDVMETAVSCGCAAYGAPTKAGNVATAAVTELSGLAASRLGKGVLFAHNDSGDTPRIFAIDEMGASLGEIAVMGATAVDWEDIAAGPCPAGSCLYVGDIGDNGMSRTNLAIYRFAEPKPDAKSVTAEKFPIQYPDGKFNAEALLVDPKTNDVLTVVKGMNAYVYRLPATAKAGEVATMERVGEATGLDGVVTAGAVSPCGDRVLLRTYTSLYEFRGTNAIAALASAPVKVPVAKEPQGEAVEYRLDGNGYFTSTEGAAPALSRVDCK
jgi:hypothetical protein